MSRCPGHRISQCPEYSAAAPRVRATVAPASTPASTALHFVALTFCATTLHFCAILLPPPPTCHPGAPPLHFAPQPAARTLYCPRVRLWQAFLSSSSDQVVLLLCIGACSDAATIYSSKKRREAGRRCPACTTRCAQATICAEAKRLISRLANTILRSCDHPGLPCGGQRAARRHAVGSWRGAGPPAGRRAATTLPAHTSTSPEPFPPAALPAAQQLPCSWGGPEAGRAPARRSAAAPTSGGWAARALRRPRPQLPPAAPWPAWPPQTRLPSARQEAWHGVAAHLGVLRQRPRAATRGDAEAHARSAGHERGCRGTCASSRPRLATGRDEGDVRSRAGWHGRRRPHGSPAHRSHTVPSESPAARLTSCICCMICSFCASSSAASCAGLAALGRGLPRRAGAGPSEASRS